jgi:hypothetical protein
LVVGALVGTLGAGVGAGVGVFLPQLSPVHPPRQWHLPVFSLPSSPFGKQVPWPEQLSGQV